MKPIGPAALILISLGLVPGCAGARDDGPARVSAQAGRISVVLIVAEPAAGVSEADLMLTDESGAAVTGATVTAGAAMARMGHSGQVATSRSTGPGRYRLSGNLFPMAGRWDLQVQVKHAGTTAVATLPIVITDR
jgi:hypothetical protein